MIHHELGYAYLIEAGGAKISVDSRTPRDVAIAKEELDAPSPDRMTADEIACAIEAVRDWLAWIFEPGPHPCDVMPRLVAATVATAPWCLNGLPRDEAQAINGLAREPELARLRILLGGCPTPGALREHAHAVACVLADAYRREGRTWNRVTVPSGVECMTQHEERSHSDADTVTRANAMATWLHRIWGDAPRLGDAMKVLFVDARCHAPELMLNMSGEEIAALFDQGRAAESARVKQLGNAMLARAGFRHPTFRFQKSVTACRTYAKRQRGNKNRATGAAKKRAA